jgi:hypothetical protein
MYININNNKNLKFKIQMPDSDKYSIEIQIWELIKTKNNNA